MKYKYQTHKHGNTTARLVEDEGSLFIAVNAYGVTSYLPIELLEPIQDDLWAFDSWKHLARKMK